MANEYRISITIDGKDTVGSAAKSAAEGIRGVGDAADKADKSAGGFFANMLASAGGFLAANVIGKIAGEFKDFIGGAMEDARGANILMAQSEAAITSTGGAAGVSAQHVADLASSLSDAAGVSLFGDDQIQASANMLLTFTNIRGATLDLATAITVDMGQAMHKSPEQMSTMIGKLLNSADAMSAAKKMGVSFSDEQVKLGKHLFETGDIAGYQKLVLAELNKEYGGSAAATAGAAGPLVQFRARMGEAAETVAGALLPAVDKLGTFLNAHVAPAIEAIASKISQALPAVIAVASEIANRLIGLGKEAWAWGSGLGGQFAAGIEAAIARVVQAVFAIAAIVTRWMSPHSPPAFLPDIAKWGEETGTLWANGLGDADLSGIADLGRTVEATLKGLVDVGKFDQRGVIPAVLGSRDAMASALSELHQFGSVGEASIQAVMRAAGPAGGRIEGLIRGFFDLERSTEDVKRAQDALNRVTREYDAILNPLNAELKQIEDQKQAIEDQIRVRDLQAEIADGKTDELTRQKDVLEIQEIQKRQQIDAVNAQKDAAISSAQAQLDAAEQQKQKAQAIVDTEQARIGAFNDQNQLIGQQIELMKRLAEEGKQGGGGGGGGPELPGVPAPKPIAEVISDVASAQIATAKARVDGLVASIRDFLMPVLGPVSELAGRMATAFGDASTPIAGIGNALRELHLGEAITAAVPDLLTGLADVRESMFQWVTDSLPGWLTGLAEFARPIGQWVLDALPGLMGNLSIFVERMIDQTITYVPQWIAALGHFAIELIAWVAAALPGLMGSLGQTLNEMANWVVDSLPRWGAELATLAGQLGQWVLDALPGLGTNLGVALGKILGWAIQTAIDVVPKLAVLAFQFVGWVATTVIPALPGVLLTIATALYNFIAGVVTEIAPKIGAIAEKFYTWVTTDVIPKLPGEIDKIKTAIGDWVLGAVGWVTGEVGKVGAGLVDGIQKGISDAWGGFKTWLLGRLAGLKDDVLAYFGISSPSTMFAEIGSQLIAGMIVGLQDMLPGLQASLNALVVAMRTSVADAGDEAVAEMEDKIKDLVDAASKLPDLIANATAGMFDIEADVSRQLERNLAHLGDFEAYHQDAIQAELAAAQAAAALIPDPAEAAKFFELRSKQIFEIADLQKQIGEAGEKERAKIEEDHAKKADDLLKESTSLAEQLAGAKTDAERAAIRAKIDANNKARAAENDHYTAAIKANQDLANAERLRLNQRLTLIRQAQAAELAALQTRQENEQSMFEKLADTIKDIFSNIDINLLAPADLVAIQQFRAIVADFARLAGLPALPPLLPPPAHASGTSFFGGGLTWVGERGRELVNLPRGSQILSNRESERIVSSRGGDKHYHLHINTSAPHEPIVQDFAFLEAMAVS